MNRAFLKVVCAIGAWIALSSALNAATADTVSHRIATAANTFLSTLDETQRKKVVFAFDDAQQRARWSNFPTAMSPRGGISLQEMTPAQRAAAMALLASVLSPAGFEKVQLIMEGDEANKLAAQGNSNRGPPPGGGNGRTGPGGQGGALFGRDLYYFSMLGSPSERDPWMLQFGGHHLALNITIAGPRGVLTPTLTGAQPAIFTLKGKTVRPLAGESDKAFTLLNALSEQQRSQAILGYRVADLVLGPGQDGRTIQPEGLKASAMNEPQRAILLDLISQWSGIIHESAAEDRMAEIKAGLGDTWFAWSGSTTVAPGSNVTAYYRIQGPNVVIEYAPQSLGGDLAMHIHTMYRDPTNDYGRKLTAK